MSVSSWLTDVRPARAGELQLIEELGPKGRRRALVATVAAAAALVALVAWVVRRLQAKGQFAPELWSPFRQWAIWKFLLLGLVNTLKAASLALVLALVLGTVMAVLRSDREPVRIADRLAGVVLFAATIGTVALWRRDGRLALAWLAALVVVALALRATRIRPGRTFGVVYVEGFRACALVLLISFGFILFPKVLPGWKLGRHAYVSVVVGLTLYYSTVLAEVIRSGIRSIPRGQSEAALAIGLTESRTMRAIVLPQAMRRALPNIVTQAASLLKDTSLGVFVTYEELTRRAQITGEFGANNLQTFIVAGGIYIAVIAFVTAIANRLEHRSAR
jgi:glutamate transport system permease protein